MVRSWGVLMIRMLCVWLRSWLRSWRRSWWSECCVFGCRPWAVHGAACSSEEKNEKEIRSPPEKAAAPEWRPCGKDPAPHQQNEPPAASNAKEGNKRFYFEFKKRFYHIILGSRSAQTYTDLRAWTQKCDLRDGLVPSNRPFICFDVGWLSSPVVGRFWEIGCKDYVIVNMFISLFTDTFNSAIFIDITRWPTDWLTVNQISRMHNHMQMYAHANKCKCNEHSHAEICTLRCTITCKWIWKCTFALYRGIMHKRDVPGENQVSLARCSTLPWCMIIAKYTTHKFQVMSWEICFGKT